MRYPWNMDEAFERPMFGFDEPCDMHDPEREWQLALEKCFMKRGCDKCDRCGHKRCQCHRMEQPCREPERCHCPEPRPPHPPRPTHCACVPIPTRANDGQVLTVEGGEYRPTDPATDNGPLTGSDYNFGAYNFNPRDIGAAGLQAADGTVYLSRIHLTRPVTVNHIFMGIVSAGSGLATGQSLAGIYDAAGSLIVQTPDQSAEWTAAGAFGVPVTQTYLMEGTYWLAIMSGGTTPPAFVASQAGAAALNILLSGDNLAFGLLPGQSALPQMVNLSALTLPPVGQMMPWIALG